MNWNATDLDVLKAADERLLEIGRDMDSSLDRRMKGIPPRVTCRFCGCATDGDLCYGCQQVLDVRSE